MEFKHISVMLPESIDLLNVNPNGIYVDGTAGGAGHSKAIAEKGYDPIYGARPLKRYIQKYVETLSAKLILADRVSSGDTILIDLIEDQLQAVIK